MNRNRLLSVAAFSLGLIALLTSPSTAFAVDCPEMCVASCSMTVSEMDAECTKGTNPDTCYALSCGTMVGCGASAIVCMNAVS
jgi:hypothetical protein